ncbi:Aste57867_8475 [Aphanomyces stellatus]|uniref:Aste57867_8475 protein n=1 Tax=Aphanomyces stellatus TaxID=120398 RepID=A0A485KKF6_9STRA|nr:hypothetical protein As57867_008443 [Aphanomyces stellatus]VFT85361.1 Aste57867_8475 [Aphanomyces stellatus]
MHPRSDAGTRATDEMSWTDIVLTDTVSDLRESLLSHAGPPIEDRRRVQPTYLLWVFTLAVIQQGLAVLNDSLVNKQLRNGRVAWKRHHYLGISDRNLTVSSSDQGRHSVVGCFESRSEFDSLT